MTPKIRYADTSAGQVAFQVFGKGPIEIVCCEGIGFHQELAWEQPIFARFYESLAAFARVALFDPRGVGMSDPVKYKELATWEDATEDFRAVIEAAEFVRPALYVNREMAMPGLLFAGAEPDRVSALIECNGAAYAYQRTGYEAGHSFDAARKISRFLSEGWGTEEFAGQLCPSLAGDSAAVRLFARMLRASCSPRRAWQIMRYSTGLDARPFLKSISVPTLLFHTRNYGVATIAMAHYLAENIPDAKLVELPGSDYTPYAESSQLVLDNIQRLLISAREPKALTGVLATVFFVDIVDSTAIAAALGDRRWKDVLQQFYHAARDVLAAFGGREIDSAGDGLFASFTVPGRAIRCAAELREVLRSLALDIRIGIHTGECEVLNEKLTGLTVNIGARVCSNAGKGEIWVSGTVKDLLVGAGFEFVDKGVHDLKGVPGKWTLYEVPRS